MVMVTRQAVERELRGDTDARAECEQDLEGWRDVLVSIVQDIDVQFADRRVVAEGFRDECRAEGSAGRARWDAYDREYQAWRRSANGYKRHVTARLREVKALVKETNVATSNWRAETWAGVREVVDEWAAEGLDGEAAMSRIEALYRRYEDMMEMMSGPVLP